MLRLPKFTFPKLDRYLDKQGRGFPSLRLTSNLREQQTSFRLIDDVAQDLDVPCGWSIYPQGLRQPGFPYPPVWMPTRVMLGWIGSNHIPT